MTVVYHPKMAKPFIDKEIYPGHVNRVDERDGIGISSIWLDDETEVIYDVPLTMLETAGVGVDDEFRISFENSTPKTITYLPPRQLTQEEVDQIWEEAKDIDDTLC